MRTFCATVFTFILFSFSAIATESSDFEEGFVALFDGKTLEGWTSARSNDGDEWGVYSVNEKEQAIHVYAEQTPGSKQISDSLNTNTEYSNYILKLEYKWLENRFAPRTEADRDAGLLFHVHGNLNKVWPLSIEMQIGESDAERVGKGRYHSGDLFVLGKQLRATTSRTNKWYDVNGIPTVAKSLKTKLGLEKPKGQWNEMEIQVRGAESAIFILNGETVLEVYDMHTVSGENGEIRTPLTSGRIGLQAEWAELLYRNIRIKQL
jgi:hypothetical protein